MEDLISRQDAIDAVKEKMFRNLTGGFYGALQVLDDLPSAQTEIVRCKDCKHNHLDGMIWNCPFGLCGGEDFFCAYGAKMKKTDDEVR